MFNIWATQYNLVIWHLKDLIIFINLSIYIEYFTFHSKLTVSLFMSNTWRDKVINKDKKYLFMVISVMCVFYRSSWYSSHKKKEKFPSFLLQYMVTKLLNPVKLVKWYFHVQSDKSYKLMVTKCPILHSYNAFYS